MGGRERGEDKRALELRQKRCKKKEENPRDYNKKNRRKRKFPEEGLVPSRGG